ncbi:MAG: histidine kinase [Bacteroidales bacterium]|nr:histidine kinase [Bacteroidales bacterium]
MKFNKKIIFACIFIAILIPLYFHIQYFLSGEQKALSYRGIGFIFSFVVSVLIFSVNLKTLDFLRRKYPWDKKLVKGIIIKTLLTNFNASVIISILVLLLYSIVPDFHDRKLSVVLFNNIVIAIIINSIALSIIEGYYLFKQWKISLIQAEKLKKENIQSQFEALKNQIDPHFLFNSLNTIYSLIEPHPDKAKEFITKFSKIYRYVLNVKDKIVVQLNEEIDFLNSYYFLQKIRHGENLEISINIDAEKLNYYIPPLSLQMLVENAIKHNIISEKKPLKIQIFNNNNFLIIKNNLQQKETINESTNIGLNNLTERYKHISEIIPNFYINDNEYIAEIPLLNDE